MRRAISFLLAGLPVSLALVTGCPAEVPPPLIPRSIVAPSVEAPPVAPPRSYTIADPDALPRGTAIALDAGAFGMVLDGSRVVVRGDDLRLARDVSAARFTSVDRVPAWLGGGFVFQTSNAVFASETFDGALRPVAATPDGSTRAVFGPKSVLVRSNDGSRRLLDLATGAAAPMLPLGLVDVLALADGRAAALLDGGHLAISTDHGDHWNDATTSLGGAPTSLTSRPGEIWIETDTGRALRVDPGGVLRELDAVPRAIPEHLRPRDPAWHGTEAPLLAAVRRGARLDDGAVIVAAAGDVARVDLRTGAVTMIAAGRLPPDLPCEALRVGDDVVAVCALPRRPSIVVAHLADGHPTIERTFPVEGPFYAGDEGTLIFGGSCDGARMRLAACVRDRHGVWRDHGVDPALIPAADAGTDGGARPALDAGADGGAPDPSAIARWIVRDDGRPMALVGGRNPGTFDPETGAVHAWKKGEDEKTFPSDIVRALEPPATSSKRGGTTLLDRRWSMSDGVLRGWLDTGQIVKIRSTGELERTSFVFPRAATAGAFGFAIDPQERAFQTLDHGETWTEVAPPPVARVIKSGVAARCSPLGCELGVWLRLGWDATPPLAAPEPPPPVTPPLRDLSPPLPEITCVSAGEERFTKLPPKADSPEDFGLGARRIPVSQLSQSRPSTYHRHLYTRGIANPAQSGSWSGDPDRVPRAILHGWAAEFTPPGTSSPAGAPGGGIVILGPGAGSGSFHRDFAFLAPFDPDGAVRATGFGLADLDAPTRGLGAPMVQLFAPEGPEIDAIAPIVPLDPAGPTGLAFSLPSDSGQLLGIISGDAAPRFKVAGVRVDPTPLTPVSAVELGGGEFAVLMVGSDGAIEVFKLGAGGVSSVHRAPAPGDSTLNPTNADALAIGAQGALAILRTPSGAEPPTAANPALLLPLGSGPIVALAPWSTLTAADDPACRGDGSGFRAVIQPAASWLHVRGGTKPHDGLNAGAGMLARVRWGASRVCLEAVEVADGSRTMREGTELETAVVARFTGKTSSAGRVGVTPGADLHQAISCKLGAP
ncbi:MAG: hypothetical protein ABJE95_06085 [Byssovorax sp.]